MNMPKSVDLLYLSPHLDDAALSCGGQIYQHAQAGKTVLIVTVMAGDPPQPAATDADAPSQAGSAYVEQLHARWQLAGNAVAARREEDLDACAILGATPVHLAIPDCVYRYDTSGYFYQSDAEIFGDIHPHERNLANRIARDLAELPPAAQIVAPLTVGHHVDHQIVRAAAEIVWGASALDYYEDYPYAEEPGGLASVLGRASSPERAESSTRGRYADDAGDVSTWRAETVALTDAALQAKCQAVAAFRSQLSTFFADDQELVQRLEAFAASRGGERLWFARGAI